MSEAIIKQKDGFLLREKIKDVKSFGAYSLCNHIEYLEEGIPFLRCVNIKNSQVDFSDVIYIDKKSHDLLWKSEVKPSTVLLTMSGSAGNVAIAHQTWKYPISSNQDIAKIDCSGGMNPYILYGFLITNYGFNQIQRQLAGSVQQHIYLWQIEKLFIPNFSSNFEKFIEKLIKFSNTTSEESKLIYQQAENLLLSELGLQDWQPTEETVAVKSFAKSFLSSGRFDAEYYQPKFDQLIERLEEKVELTSLGNLLTLNQRGKQPIYIEDENEYKMGLPVVNSKHVREGEVILTNNRYAYLPETDVPLTIKTDDVLINGTGVGTIGRCAPYLYKQEALPDNHVTILRTDLLDSVYLSIYLNSIIGKLFVEKYFKGSSGQIELYPNEIAQFQVWDAPDSIQQEIRGKVEASHKMREQSKQLLEIAKTGVERAIETDEATATTWINHQLEALEVKIS
jgi:type I restriction enzyme M protein